MSVKPTNSQLSIIFDSEAMGYDQSTSRYAVMRRNRILLSWAKGKCLEIGAGTGELTRLLIKNHTVVATDISPQMVKEIQKKVPVKAIACDAEKLPFANNSFDTVIVSEVIYYLDNPVQFVKEAYRVLRPGGRLLLTSATNLATLYDRLRSIFRMLGFKGMYFNDPIQVFPQDFTIISLFKNANFSIKEIRYIIFLPYNSLDWLNKLIENLSLHFLCSFIAIEAEK